MILDCLHILYSLVLLPCVPEIIRRLPLAELDTYISSLKSLIKNRDSLYTLKFIRDFLKRVSENRKDAAHLVEDELSGAENDGEISIWQSELIQDQLDLVDNPQILCEQVKYYVEEAVRSGIWLELYSYLALLYCSPNTYNRLILKMFEEELLACPKRLSPKQLQSMTEKMLLLSKYARMVRPQILGFMGDLVNLYPSLMNKVKIELSRLMLESMDKLDFQPTVQAMKSLLAFLQLFKEGNNQDFFKEVLRITMLFLNHRTPEIKLYATEIVCEIVRRSRSFPHSSITEIVESHLPKLFINLHSRIPEISMSAAVCIKHCLPHVKGARFCRNLLSKICRPMQGPNSTYIEDVYTQLQRRRLLKHVLCLTIDRMDTIEDREAFLKHICVLREMIPYSQIVALDIYKLLKGLEEGANSKKPDTRKLAKIAGKALKEKWSILGIYVPIPH